MSLPEKLEARFGKYAIPGLIRYVVLLNGLVFLLQVAAPGYIDMLILSRELIFQGQIWRLVTWIFIPATMSPLFLLIALYFLWFLGEGLEQMWGAFRLNLFYFTGMLGCTISAMLFDSGAGANSFLNLSILFAFATLQPNYQILLFLILPVKIKWLAWVSLGLVVLGFLTLPVAGKAAIVVSLANYLLFFGPEFVRNRARASANAARLARFQAAMREDETLHRCNVCGRTEVTNPELDFRVSADGNEYCAEHRGGKTESPDS